MTVREWIEQRARQVPAALSDRMFEALGRDAAADAARTADVCLDAAARALDELLTNERFGRDSALTLLAIDALTTYGYEHASVASGTARPMRDLADRGSDVFGRFVSERG